MPKRQKAIKNVSSAQEKKLKMRDESPVTRYYLRSCQQAKMNDEVAKSEPVAFQRLNRESSQNEASGSQNGGGDAAKTHDLNGTRDSFQKESATRMSSGKGNTNKSICAVVSTSQQVESSSSSFQSASDEVLPYNSQEKAFSIYLIVKRILDFTRIIDFPSCMNLCPMWKQIIDAQLTTFTIKLNPALDSSTFPVQLCQRGETTNTFLTMKDIKLKLKCYKWKVIWLQIWGRSIFDPLVMSFIEEFGQSIVTFGFEGSDPPPQCVSIRMYYSFCWSFLRRKLPFIMNVAFKPLQNRRRFIGEHYPHIDGFPNLKSLLIWRNPNNGGLEDSFLPVDLQILLKSPKLEQIYGFPLKHLHLLESMKKINTIKTFYHQINNFFVPVLTAEQVNLIHLEMLVENEVQLQNLKIEDCFRLQQFPERNSTCLGIFKSLINTSKNSLTRLCLQNLNFTSQLQFPVIPNLQELSLFDKGENTNPEPFFPRDFNPKKIFPNLKSLELNLTVQTPQQLNSSLLPVSSDSEKSVPQLKLLKFHKAMNVECVKVVSKYFPHVTDIMLHLSDRNVKKMLPRIFRHFPYIRHLRLEIEVGNSATCLDSAVLGIRESTLSRLRLLNFFRGHRKLRKFPSLLDLKALKSLTFVFIDKGGPILNGHIFTDMFPRYGLNLMQTLGIKIGFEADTSPMATAAILHAVQPILPYSKPLF